MNKSILYRVRKYFSWSQKEVAHRIGTSPSNVSKLEMRNSSNIQYVIDMLKDEYHVNLTIVHKQTGDTTSFNLCNQEDNRHDLFS